MSKNLVNKVGECSQDNLIAGLFPRALTTGIKVAAGEGVLKRGTILSAKGDGTYVICGKKVTTGEGESATTTTYATPSLILTEDVDASGSTAVVAVAYHSGNFNPHAVIVAKDYTLTAADKDNLRKYNIMFTDMMDD